MLATGTARTEEKADEKKIEAKAADVKADPPKLDASKSGEKPDEAIKAAATIRRDGA